MNQSTMVGKLCNKKKMEQNLSTVHNHNLKDEVLGAEDLPILPGLHVVHGAQL